MTANVRVGQLIELAGLFLKLGTIAFGGPAAHIAMMEEEVVRRRRWLEREQFLDLFAATQLIPGPNSTEMAIHIGRLRAGWPGLLVAGACFILPAAAIVMLIARAYVEFGSLPETAAILYGVKPVVIAIVLRALVELSRTAISSAFLAALGLAALAAVALGANELAVLAGAGVVAALARGVPRPPGSPAMGLIFSATAWAAPSAGAVVSGSPFGLTALFLTFAKIGAVLFGSGYVLIAFLRTDLVSRLGWLTEPQLLDAVAVGQVTPGPVFTTATFIGYLLGGWAGALVATVAIFLPAFVFVAASGPLIPRIRRSKIAGAVLDGVVVASLALLAVATWHLGRAAIVDLPTAALATASAVLLMWFRVSPAPLVLAGALLGGLSAWLAR